MQELIQSEFANGKVKKFEIKVYFVVYELFSNIIKHSYQKKGQITLYENNYYFTITIHDDGKGFKTEK